MKPSDIILFIILAAAMFIVMVILSEPDYDIGIYPENPKALLRPELHRLNE